MDRIFRILRIAAVSLISVGGIIVMLIWLAGGFHEKIPPGPAEVGLQPLGDAATVEVRTVSVPLFEDAVGTVRATHETGVGAKIMSRVLSVHFRAGDQVEEGQVLVELENGDLEARVNQMHASVQSAQSALDQARTNYDRIERLRETDSASKLEITTAKNDLNAAMARLEKARSSLQEAEAYLGYATIRSPLTGVVIDKTVSVGDMVRPGETVARLYDQLQLVATVRESLATSLEVNQQVPVTLEALEHSCKGTISEIVPESDVLSRVFQVKVTGPCPPGVIPGMFGRLHIRVGEQEELRIPASTVLKIGQIPFVYRVGPGDTIERTFIQIRQEDGDQIVVTSGLSEGDHILVSPETIEQ